MPIRLIAPGYSSEELQSAASRLLAASELCSMATRSEAGVVDINTAFFAFTPDLTLYFLSHPASAHCRNLSHVPQMALTVFTTRQGWGEPHAGLQLYGVGEQVKGVEVTVARKAYEARFAGYRHLMMQTDNGAEGSSRLAGLELFRFSPARIKLLDEALFGDQVFIFAEVRR